MSEPTLVVNIRTDPFDAYIGRAGKGMPGTFGNPYRPGEGGAVACLNRFADYFLKRVEADPEFRRQVLALRGKRLGCFCAPPGGATARDPLVCHGQVIAAWLDSQPW